MTTEMKDEKTYQGESRPNGSFAKEISLWALLARGSIYKILTALVIMVSVECVLFYKALRESEGWEITMDARFERILAYSGINIVFLLTFWLVGLLLERSQSETRGSRSGYTLRRLRITERHLFWVMTAYDFLCFVLLFAVQIWVGLVMCRLYREMMPAESLSPQLEFLAFYRSDLLHAVLPLADTQKWVKNLLMLLALSTTIANQNSPNHWQNVGLPLCAAIWWMVTGGIGYQGGEGIWYIAFVVIIMVSVLRGMGIWSVDKSIEEPE